MYNDVQVGAIDLPPNPRRLHPANFGAFTRRSIHQHQSPPPLLANALYYTQTATACFNSSSPIYPTWMAWWPALTSRDITTRSAMCERLRSLEHGRQHYQSSE